MNGFALDGLWNWFFGSRRTRLKTPLAVETCVARLKGETASDEFRRDSRLSAQVGDYGGVISRTSFTQYMDRFQEMPGELSVRFQGSEPGSVVNCTFDSPWTLRTYSSFWCLGVGLFAAVLFVAFLAGGVFSANRHLFFGFLAATLLLPLGVGFAFLHRSQSLSAERALLLIVEKALDARPVEGAAP